MAPSRSPTPCLPLLCLTLIWPEETSQYDPQKAKELLEKAANLSWAKNVRKNGQPLRIELSVHRHRCVSKSMAEIIQADMRQIGADAR
ncbi:hypothetical protein ACLB1T_09660 [Escherichia coli]